MRTRKDGWTRICPPCPEGWEPIPTGRYNPCRAMTYSGCTSRQLRYWDQVGLIRPSISGTGGRMGVERVYSADDLKRLKKVVELLNRDVSLQRIRGRIADARREDAGRSPYEDIFAFVIDELLYETRRWAVSANG